VAALLKCSDQTVKAMVREGRLPMVKPRGQWVIRRSDFDRWLRENTW
jgi:excisionase family DNA binding protein